MGKKLKLLEIYGWYALLVFGGYCAGDNNALGMDENGFSITSVVKEVDDINNKYTNSSIDLIETLDMSFFNSYKNGDYVWCCITLNSLINEILKAKVAEAYNLDINKINKFDCVKCIFKEPVNGEILSAREFGIVFEYEGVKYSICLDKNAELIGMIYDDLYRGMIGFKNDDDIYWMTFDEAYGWVKGILLSKPNICNDEVTFKCVDYYSDSSVGEIKWDGTFELTYDYRLSTEVIESLVGKNEPVVDFDSLCMFDDSFDISIGDNFLPKKKVLGNKI